MYMRWSLSKARFAWGGGCGEKQMHSIVICVPAIVMACKLFMNCIGTFDQLRASHMTARLQRRLSVSIFTFSLDGSIQNWYKFYQMRDQANAETMLLKKFKWLIAEAIVAPYIAVQAQCISLRSIVCPTNLALIGKPGTVEVVIYLALQFYEAPMTTMSLMRPRRHMCYSPRQESLARTISCLRCSTLRSRSCAPAMHVMPVFIHFMLPSVRDFTMSVRSTNSIQMYISNYYTYRTYLFFPSLHRHRHVTWNAQRLSDMLLPPRPTFTELMSPLHRHKPVSPSYLWSAAYDEVVENPDYKVDSILDLITNNKT